MRASTKALWILAAILTTGGGQSTGGRLIPALSGTPAGIHLFIQRIGSTDTILVDVGLLFDATYGRTAEWSLAVPSGLAQIVGPAEGRGVKRDIRGSHKLLLRCERWGDFQFDATMTAMQDSLNLVRHDYRAMVHITADSFTVTSHPAPYGPILRQYIIDGIHYRWHGSFWLPLDPGEDEEVEPGFQSRAVRPPTLHAEPAAHALAAGPDTTFEVPIFVAVDRTGRVKDARLNIGRERIPNAVQQLALAAAWRWRFAPAQSLGRTVSTIYFIRVPVTSGSER